MTDSYSILIIEDEKNILDFMAKTLRSNGYKTITSETGQSGLSIINSHCPDLILLDLGLPDMDGNDIISSVRIKLPLWISVPMITLQNLSVRPNYWHVSVLLCVTVTVWLPILLFLSGHTNVRD